MRKLIALSLILIVAFTGCNYIYEPQRVTGKVTKKEYKVPYSTTTMVMSGKVIVPVSQHYPAKFIVVARYKDIEGSTNSRTIYEEVDVGDDIEVEYIKVFNRNGELKREYINIK